MNKVIALFKFILIFSLFVGITIPSYYYFSSSTSKKIQRSFSPENIRNTCPSSPENESFQACFRKKVSELINESSPIEILSISELVTSLHQRDIYQNIVSKKDADLDFFTTWALIIDQLKIYQIDRKKIDFLQITTLPILRRLLMNQLMEVKSQADSFLSQHPEFKEDPLYLRIFNRIISVKIQIF